MTIRKEATLFLIFTYDTAGVQYTTSIFFSRYLLPLALPLPVKVIGFVMDTNGVLLFILAITDMRDNWRAGVDESQSTEMIYPWNRLDQPQSCRCRF